MWKALGGLLAMVALVGCSGGGGSAPAGSGSGSPAAGTAVALTGAGATFPYPLYTKWVAEYDKANPGVAINYQSIGSGGGIRQITEKTVDFGASDAPMNDEQIGKAQGIVHIPTCLGAVVLAYNIEGVSTGLKLTPDTLSGIFLGDIKQWDDPKLKADNPDVNLPQKPIATVHRSDGSGTTKIFLDYLSAVSPAWAKGPGSGTSVSWPNGLGAKGNEGVSGQVKGQPNSIGYIELAYAMQNKMAMASLKNKAGKFVAPTLEGITAAAAGASAKMPEDLRISIVDAEGDAAYPISGFTYILLYGKQTDAAKGKALVGFLNWALADGQKLTSPLDYAPLPAEVVEKAKKRLAGVKGPDDKPLQ
ncbi:MAG: phosphate ABC transporter substrate-binding protein PstS [Polyangiaceae bacterium]